MKAKIGKLEAHISTLKERNQLHLKVIEEMKHSKKNPKVDPDWNSLILGFRKGETIGTCKKIVSLDTRRSF